MKGFVMLRLLTTNQKVVSYGQVTYLRVYFCLLHNVSIFLANVK
jgi:hypothetical protein